MVLLNFIFVIIRLAYVTAVLLSMLSGKKLFSAVKHKKGIVVNHL